LVVGYLGTFVKHLLVRSTLFLYFHGKNYYMARTLYDCMFSHKMDW
jgi:hypothetical protein